MDLLVENREICIPHLYLAPPYGVTPSELCENENLYSPHNSDSSSDKINTILYNKNTKKINLNV